MQHLHHILNDGSHLVYVWFEAMHTRMDLMLWDDVAENDLFESAEAVYQEVARIERMGSCFLPDSEVSRINTSPVGESVTVSGELMEILTRCIGYNLSTGGLFDITASEELPGIGIQQKLGLDPETHSVSRRFSQVRVNLSGYLKGYALDRAADIVRASVRNGLMNFGNSSVYAFGNHPGGSGWPVTTGEEPGPGYVLHNECLTTSGNSSDQRKHIINPLTGNMIEGKGMVSVLSRTAEEGEVMSTVSFIRNSIETKTK